MKNLVLAGISCIILLSGCGSESSSSSKGDSDGVNEQNTANMNASSGSETRFNLKIGKVDAINWQFAYQKYIGFKTNGGTSGSGSISACIAKKYDALYDTNNKPVQVKFEQLSADSTKADFEAVNKSDCTQNDYVTDSIDTQIEQSDWLSASFGQTGPVFSASTDMNNSWIIRSSTGDTYARVKVKTVEVDLSIPKRKIILSSELYQNGEFLTAVNSPELDFTNSKAYWDLETNTLSASESDWDIAISVVGRKYQLEVGGGKGLVITPDGAQAVTDPTDSSQVYTYFADAASGAMSGPSEYGAFEFNIAKNRKMWPNFTTYIFKDGENYFKAQVLSNYGKDGTLASGNLYIRYKKLD